MIFPHKPTSIIFHQKRYIVANNKRSFLEPEK